LAPGPAQKTASVNLAVAAAVFPVIFLGELPDKTMFASLVMATRGRPSPSGSARPRLSPCMW
jgi:putative Ca2+/H+ antiporter (TMEM165/GDT1 family)